MNLKFVMYGFAVSAFMLSVTVISGQCDQSKADRKPVIALILAGPASDGTAESGTDKSAQQAVEDAEMPAPDDASIDSPAVIEDEEGGQVEDPEGTVHENAADHFNAGVAHDKSGMHGEAIKSYRKAIDIAPDYPEAYYNLAFSYLLTDDVESAHDQYMLLKDINPRMAEDLYTQALVMVCSSPVNKYAVQVGAFRNVRNAHIMLDKLKASYMHVRIDSEDGYSKVRLFGLKNREEAGTLIRKIKADFKIDPFIITMQ
ncbi:MAG: SPOR domain-containing protein [Nitrospirota bacterium]